MEHESFEDAETAALMNEHFVSVKVDREERPDLDAVYMDAVVALTGHGGWPMTVFLTPEGEPFFGGTYFPPAPRHGLPSFRQVLEAVAQAYRERRAEVAESARQLVEAVRESSELAPSSEPLTDSILSEAARGLRRGFDPEWGGFGGAPKFPPASTLELLLRRGELDLVTKTLDAMAAGGMYDLVGGGFHRYSVDERLARPALREDALRQRAARPRVPARVGRDRRGALPRASSRRPATTCSATSRCPEGGFASSQDADTDGVEGLTYTWTEDEGVPAELLAPVRARALDHPRRARPGAAGAPARGALAPSAAGARRQGDRRLERARARRARGGRAAAVK